MPKVTLKHLLHNLTILEFLTPCLQKWHGSRHSPGCLEEQHIYFKLSNMELYNILNTSKAIQQLQEDMKYFLLQCCNGYLTYESDTHTLQFHNNFSTHWNPKGKGKNPSGSRGITDLSVIYGKKVLLYIHTGNRQIFINQTLIPSQLSCKAHMVSATLKDGGIAGSS